MMIRLCISITMILITLAPGTAGAWVGTRMSQSVDNTVEPTTAADALPAATSSFSSDELTSANTDPRVHRSVSIANSIGDVRHNVQQLAAAVGSRLTLVGDVSESNTTAAMSSVPTQPATSARLSFSGATDGRELLGDHGATTVKLLSVSYIAQMTRNDAFQYGVGAGEATNASLLESRTSVPISLALSTQFANFDIVTAFKTFSSSIVSSVKQDLGATPVVLVFGFSASVAQSNATTIPTRGSNAETTLLPALLLAILSALLILVLTMLQAAHGRIARILAQTTLSVYVPPG